MRTFPRFGGWARATTGFVVLAALVLAAVAILDDGGSANKSEPGPRGLACGIEDVTSVDVVADYRRGSETPRQAAEAFIASWMPTLSADGLVRAPQIRGEDGVRFVYRFDDAKLVDLTVDKGFGLWSGHYFTACKEVVEEPEAE